jgi:hypothetical protein
LIVLPMLLMPRQFPETLPVLMAGDIVWELYFLAM